MPAEHQLTFDGERFVPGGVESEIDLEHYHRYLAAAELTRDLVIADVACGAGYGSAILSKFARLVTGVDISELAVAAARSNFAGDNLRFQVGNCVNLPFDDRSLDAVVSFETIEHITQQDEFLDECKRVLKPKGMLIISTPHRERYNAQLAEPNPHHLREMSEEEFRDALTSRFQSVHISGQRVMFGSVILPPGSAAKFETLRRTPDNAILKEAARNRSVYLVAVCTDGPARRFPSGSYEGGFPPNALSSLIGGVKERDQLGLELRHELSVAKADALKISADNAAELARFRSEADALRAELTRATDTRTMLVRELEMQTVETRSTRARLEGAESVLAEALKAGDRRASEIVQMRGQVGQLQAALADLEGERARLSTELEGERETSTRLEAEVHALEAALGQAHDLTAELDRGLTSARQELETRGDALEALSTQLAEARVRIVTLGAERDDARRYASQVADTFKSDHALTAELLSRAMAAESVLLVERERVDKLVAELERRELAHADRLKLVSDAELLREEKDRTYADLLQIQERLLAAEIRAAEQGARADIAAAGFVGAEQTCERLSTELAEAQRLIGSLEADLAGEKTRLKILEDELVADKHATRSMISDLIADKNEARGLVSALLADAGDFQERTAKLAADRHAVEAQLQTLRDNIGQAEQLGFVQTERARRLEADLEDQCGTSARLEADLDIVARRANELSTALGRAIEAHGVERAALLSQLAETERRVERVLVERVQAEQTFKAAVAASEQRGSERLRLDINHLYGQLQTAADMLDAGELERERLLGERQLAEVELRKAKFVGARAVSAAWRHMRRNSYVAAPFDLAAFIVRFGFLKPKKSLSLAHQTFVIRKSGVFDEQSYLSRYFDVRIKRKDPVRHYVLHGAGEGRDPASGFSTRAYLAANADVQRSALNPLYHYLKHGRIENRRLGSDRAFANFIGPRPAAAAPAGAAALHSEYMAEPSEKTGVAVDLYQVRPDDVVHDEAERGRRFLDGHRLLSDTPDFAAATSVLANGSRCAAIRNPKSDDRPVATIVVPVYGQLAYTLNCLDSLARHASKYPFEVIVIDDRSPDETKLWLSGLSWIRFVHQTENQGFLQTCNNAGKIARGEYIVLLNNDTRVVDGWLDEMIDSFASFSKAGLVGSKLFYPDGTLQEAGGIVWQDGSAWNYGRNDDPNRTEYCYARQVDYVSGASIALPIELWHRLGGFDERYRPAYCEDTDLAFQVREVGREVWMQPLSRVIHYEGKTSGTDITKGVKAYQVINAKKFVDRWQHVLATHRPNAEQPKFERDRLLKKRALIVDAVTPTPLQDAGSVTTFTTLQIYQTLGYKTNFVPEDNFLFWPPHSPRLQRLGVECAYVPFDWNFEDHIKRHGADYDFIQVYRFNVLQKILPLLRQYAPQAPIAFHNMDIHYLRMERQALLTNDLLAMAEARRVKELELEVVRNVDCTIVHSPDEKVILEGEVPGAQIVVFPYMTELVGTSAPFLERKDFMFLGGYGHSPNEDAVVYFVKSIWPELRKLMPGAKFYAVGSRPTEALRALASEDVIITGGVDDLRPYFDRCRVFVCPIRYGAGVKGKVSTSMAHGLPVVTSSIGAEGMGLTNGRNVLIADDPDSFIACVKKLYSDEDTWRNLSECGLRFVAEENSYDMGVRAVAKVVEVATAQHRQRG